MRGSDRGRRPAVQEVDPERLATNLRCIAELIGRKVTFATAEGGQFPSRGLDERAQFRDVKESMCNL